MARPPLTLFRLLGLVWRPLRKLTEETRLQRVALEAIAQDLALLRGHLMPGRPAAEDPEEDAVGISFTSNQEQRLLEQVAADLTTTLGVPPSEDEILQEYTHRLDIGTSLAREQQAKLGRMS